MAETFGQITKCLLNSFCWSWSNHCSNTDCSFISFSTCFLFSLENFTIERESLVTVTLFVNERKAILSVFSNILQLFLTCFLPLEFSHVHHTPTSFFDYIQCFSIRKENKYIPLDGYITIYKTGMLSGYQEVVIYSPFQLI